MKAYGIPRSYNVGDSIRLYGLQSSVGYLPGKGGDIRSYFRSAAAKARARRMWKRVARRQGKVACAE